MASAKVKQKENKLTVSYQDLGIRSIPPKNDSETSFALWVRSLIQNWRQGTVSCKGRSEIARSGKKPWKQKGTGRARAGSARSPLWRGGGVTFGPQPRVRRLKVQKEVKKKVFGALFYDFLNQGKIVALEVAEVDRPKTSIFNDLFKGLNLTDKKLLIFLPIEDLMSYASLRNLPNVRLVFFDQPNAFDLAKSDYWVFFKKDFDRFKEMVLRWTKNAAS
ncbi:50S ribosomal protein L4 [Candidatus Dependentiae bacterium]|nr:MAG: 50S ribosomal protein L4 [Candidatus Dependentiae bacterium]